MRFVQYGAGNIGRGFIAPLFSDAGYEVCFIDVNETLIDAINKNGGYIQEIVSSDGSKEVKISGVRAVNANDADKAAAEIAKADLMATAVGVNVIPYIVPVIVSGLKIRMKTNAQPLNIIICENLLHADRMLRDMVCRDMNDDEKAWVLKNVGFVETSIGRMVPVMTPEMQKGEPARICVEPYDELPVDADALCGKLPEIVKVHPFTPFEFYIKRKLYLHNMAHSLCAYFGSLHGCEYIWQAVANPYIKLIATRAMNESALALSSSFAQDMSGLSEHCDDLLLRFSNTALGDTVSRVGRDTRRKLAPDDRYEGALTLCAGRGGVPVYICAGAAAALFFNTPGDIGSQYIETEIEKNGVDSIICSYMGIPADSIIYALIKGYYDIIKNGGGADVVLTACEQAKKLILGQKTVI